MSEVILWDNKIDGATITVTSEVAGFEKENAYDGFTYDFWKPIFNTGTDYYNIDLGSAQSMSAWAIAAHDLGTNSASIELQYEAADADAWTTPITVGSALSPDSTEAALKTFAAISKRYWRFKIVSASVASQIGVLMLGPYITSGRGPRVGHSPVSLSTLYKSRTNVSFDALMIGQSAIKAPIEVQVQWEDMTRAWVDANWLPFLRYAEQNKGFMYAADPDSHTDEVSYLSSSSPKTASTGDYSDSLYLTVKLKCMGITI